MLRIASALGSSSGAARPITSSMGVPCGRTARARATSMARWRVIESSHVRALPPPDGEEDLLDDVLGRLGVAEHVVGHGEGRAAKAGVERIERAEVAAGDAGEQRLVRGL